MTRALTGFSDSGLPLRASEDAANVCHIPGCADDDTWDCLFCGTLVCEKHGRWAESEGFACPNCVVELVTEAGDVIYVSKREAEKEMESAVNAEENRKPLPRVEPYDVDGQPGWVASWPDGYHWLWFRSVVAAVRYAERWFEYQKETQAA